jgi:hypothetical protein
MAKKKIDLGKVGPAGDTVGVTGTLEDDTLGAGDRTTFLVTLKREEGPATTPLTIWTILLGMSALDLYPPFKTIGNGRIEELKPGESKEVPFLVDNGPEGASPAAYSLLCVIQWDEYPPLVLPVFNVP